MTGKVLVKNQPAVGATVMFFPTSGAAGVSPSTGTCGADGVFTLSTGTGQGAPAGDYVVAVTWPDPKVKFTEQQKMMGMAGDAPDVLKGAYSKDKTKLKAQIKAQPNNLDPFVID